MRFWAQTLRNDKERAEAGEYCHYDAVKAHSC